MHAQQQAKKYFKFFNASDQTEFRPNPCRTRHQADLWCTQMQILLSACQISKFQNFHNFLKSHQPKGCFLSDRQKSPEFHLLKNVKKKKTYSCIFFKKKSDIASQHRRPQKGQKKSILIFANFFAFLAPPARCGSNEYHVHRSEVNIYRVMTRNVSAVFKEESTLHTTKYRIIPGPTQDRKVANLIFNESQFETNCMY